LTTEFAYNGDGVRTRKTVGGHTTQYVLDLATTLPVVISDTDGVYLYGLDIIAQQQAERQYYMHDGLGSVRQLVDTTGQIETNYAYDPFGVPVMGGDGSNPYQLTGEAWDAEVELLYLRARYYQPEVGRFITKDPWAGVTGQPGTLNRFAYVTNSPANRVDPRGLEGGEPGGICPECKEVMHEFDPVSAVLDWFSDDEAETWTIYDEDDCEEYHEWIRHWRWPDPWGGEELGSPGQESVPLGEEWASPLRVVLTAQAERMYESTPRIGLKNLRAIAESRQDNPLSPKLLERGCLGGITVRTIANTDQFPFTLLMIGFGMDAQHVTNYEPYFLTLLMETNKGDLPYIEQHFVHPWWCNWTALYDVEPEEYFHLVGAQ
jgi:RHS repeat-associated protein